MAFVVPDVGPSGPVGPTSTLSINNARVDESVGNVLVRVDRSFNTNIQASFSFTILDGSARQGEDYSGITAFPGFFSGQGTFLPGVTQTTISVAIVDDAVGEADEVFTVRLFDPIQANIGVSSGFVTILDNDGGLGDFLLARGSSANERMVGGDAKERISGAAGDDTISAGGGGDIVYGNQGADLMFGNAGADTVYGGQGSDTIHGGRDDDMVYGNLGNDRLFGELGGDVLFGGQGADTVSGGDGNDSLLGNRGADSLEGNAGDDTLNGGPGDDRLIGGDGADQFHFTSNNGNDVVVDGPTFSPSRDLIYIESNINGSGITTPAQLLANLSDNALGQAVLDLGGGNTITFQSFNSAWFVSGDFVFF